MEDPENPFTNPFDLFVSECHHVDIEIRLNSIKKLSTVAVALDTERTKNELIPFLDTLSEGLYNDNEMLLSIAEQLANFIPFVGGIENVDVVLNILEKLAAIEENVVRFKAIESLEKIALTLDATNLENIFIPRVIRLGNSEWFTSKSSATALVWVCYERSSVQCKVDLRNLYRVICQDESPLVRRSAAVKLTKLVDVLELNYLKDEFIPVFDNFSKDEQDSVRLLAVDVGICIALRLKSKEIEDYILTTISKLCGDGSWRVRYQVANQIAAIQAAVGSELTRKHLIAIYYNLAHDTESQVREIAAKNIVRFCQILQQTYLEEKMDIDGENPTDPVILDQILPLVHYLYQDNTEVKESLSAVVPLMSPILGVEQTKQLLLPLITQSLMTDSSRVKENIISNLNSIISVIGISDIVDTILVIMIDLVNSSASVWRTRRNLIVTINYIANYLGQEYFDAHIKSLYIKLLSDGVYAVRKTAPLILPILMKNFGEAWASRSIIPSVLLFSEHKHYLYRFVCLFCIDELVRPTLEATSRDTRLEFIQNLNDLDPNVHNEAAKVLYKVSKLNNALKVRLEESWVGECIKLLERYDTADDIEKYAEETIATFKKDNIILTKITENEIYLPKTSYLEGILKLSLNKFMAVLKILAADPVPNVQVNAAKTLVKIKNFSQSLERELEQSWIQNILEEKNEYLVDCLGNFGDELKLVSNECITENSGVVQIQEDTRCNADEEITAATIATDEDAEEISEKDNSISLETELIGILEEKLNTKPSPPDN